VLQHIADGVLIHVSEFLKSNAVVVQGPTGVLLVDAGVRESELACLASDLAELGQAVVAGFSTHPHWDHLLWHPLLGTAPRYGSAGCAATVKERLSDAGAKARVAGMIPSDIVDEVPLDLLGHITGLPVDAEQIPWDGPEVRIIKHQAHAAGHTALLIEQRGVLVAGDTLSDLLIPLLNVAGATQPFEDYLEGLQLLEGVAGDVEVVVPGHGSIARGEEVQARIDLDRAYVLALRQGHDADDPRLTSDFGKDWLPGVHERQLEQLGPTVRHSG
jgi:glyoxylase-like metal-dependent hydrolase (beta-lactamase superfamily II)